MRLDLNKETDSKLIGAIIMDLSAYLPADKLINLVKRAKYGISVEIRALRDGKSRSQENYYWKSNRDFANFCGMYPDELHDYLLAKCFGTENIQTRLGPKLRTRVRSSDLTQDEYSVLIEGLIQTAAEFGYIVEPPVRHTFQQRGNYGSASKKTN